MQILTCILILGLIHDLLPVAIEHNILQMSIIELALLTDALLDDCLHKGSQLDAFQQFYQVNE